MLGPGLIIKIKINKILNTVKATLKLEMFSFIGIKIAALKYLVKSSLQINPIVTKSSN